jgi:NADH-quinone oxidoreductase subunit G
MTTTQDSAVAVEMITVVIDGFEVSVPKGTLVIFHVSAITHYLIQ